MNKSQFNIQQLSNLTIGMVKPQALLPHSPTRIPILVIIDNNNDNNNNNIVIR